jgi:hypothetical protein
LHYAGNGSTDETTSGDSDDRVSIINKVIAFFFLNSTTIIFKEGILMAINIKFNEVGIIGIVVGVIGTAYGIWREKKGNDLAKKLDTTLSSLESKTKVDISQDVVNKATKNAVERHANAYAKKAAEEAADLIRDDMDSMIRKDVDRVYNELKGKVDKRVDEEIENLDFDAMTEEAQKRFGKIAFDTMCNRSGFSGQLMRVADRAVNGQIDLTTVTGILDQFWSDSEKIEALKMIFGKGA